MLRLVCDTAALRDFQTGFRSWCHVPMLVGAGKKRRRAAAVQDAGALQLPREQREASWSEPVLWRSGALEMVKTNLMKI